MTHPRKNRPNITQPGARNDHCFFTKSQQDASKEVLDLAFGRVRILEAGNQPVGHGDGVGWGAAGWSGGVKNGWGVGMGLEPGKLLLAGPSQLVSG